MLARALPAFALLATAFAGCLAPTEEVATQSPLPTQGAAAFPTVTHLLDGLAADPAGLAPLAAAWRALGHDAVEPTLGLTSDGTIFYAAAKFDELAPGRRAPMTDVLRSKDGGLTWEDVTPRLPNGMNSPPTTGDPYIYVDPATDRVFNYDMFPALACGYLSFSDDGGESWTTSPVGCGTPPPYDHQTIVAAKPRTVQTVGYPNVVVHCINRVTDSICARSLDGGMTWAAGAPAFLGVDPSKVEASAWGVFDGFCGGLHGHVVAAPDGTLYLPREYCGDAYVAVSRDDATTWTTVKVAEDASAGPDPAVAVDADGNVYYAFVDTSGLLRLSVSTDAGATWTAPRVVSAPAVTAAHLPAIAAGDAGEVVLAYAGTENLPDGYANEEFEQPSSERPKDGAINSATWNGYLAVIENALDAEPVVQTAMVNDPADPLVRGYCGPGRCPGMYDFIDVVVGPDGRPWAAFVDACVDACAEPDGTYEDSQGRAMAFAGAVATLSSGPRLVGEGALDPLPSVT